jgi:hypothetical protein
MSAGASRGDRGEISLAGLLVASVISLVVLGSVLTIFEGASAHVAQLTARNDNQQAARLASDGIAAALRNLASPTPDQPQAIDRATAYDLVFQDVDPAGPNSGANATNVRRERWCLGTNGTLYSQRQTWTTATVPAMPATTACPGTGWPTTTTVAQNVTNLQGGQTRAVFTYDAAALTDVAQIHVDLFLDQITTRSPTDTRVSTGAFLRNQNRKPVASFTASPTAQGIVLNASASADPEGQSLTYTWLDGGSAIAGGTGVTMTYPVTAGSSHTLSVRVRDPAGLTATSAAQVVVG